VNDDWIDMKRSAVAVWMVCCAVLVSCSAPLSEEAVPSDCAVDVQYEGRIFSSDPIVVGEGELLAVRIDGQPTSGFGVERRVAAYRIIDASIDNSQGWPELSTEPGAYYQSFTSEFGVLVTFDIAPGTYNLTSSSITNGLVGTCPR